MLGRVWRIGATFAVLMLCRCGRPSDVGTHISFVEADPDYVESRRSLRDTGVEAALQTNALTLNKPSLKSVVETLVSWPTTTITVAFDGGKPALCREIMSVAKEWCKYANVTFDYEDPYTGFVRRWSRDDRTYSADVRITFSNCGYSALIGRESIDLASPGEPTMSLEGFDNKLPDNWKAVVLHEFGHVLGFYHEHQSPTGGCESEFRWDDDNGYVPTKNNQGEYVEDGGKRHPGLYTVLSGRPNKWKREKVDHNMRQLVDDPRSITSSEFDPKSIMKYYFPEWMFKNGQTSRCYSSQNEVLSDKDKVAVGAKYPRDQLLGAKLQQQELYLKMLLESSTISPALRQQLEFHMNSIRR